MSERQEVDSSQRLGRTDDELLALAWSMSGFVCAPVTGVALARGVRLLCARIRRSIEIKRLERDFARPACSRLAGNSTTKGTM